MLLVCSVLHGEGIDLRLTVSPGKRIFTVGEPIYVKVQVENISNHPIQIDAPWNYRPERRMEYWVRKENSNEWEKWKAYSPRIGSKTGIKIWLAAKERIEIWHRLHPPLEMKHATYYAVVPDVGKYTVKARYRSNWHVAGNEHGFKKMAWRYSVESQPAEFEVVAPEGKAKDVWDKFAPLRKKYRMDAYFWLFEADLEELKGTPYWIWAQYLRLESCLTSPNFSLRPQLYTWLDRIFEKRYWHSDFPFWSRLQLLVEAFNAVRFTSINRPDWKQKIRPVLRRLMQERDLEWVDIIVPILATKAMRTKGIRGKEDYDRRHSEVLKRWKYPWYSLPLEERPRF
jgi:hypothetical protein